MPTFQKWFDENQHKFIFKTKNSNELRGRAMQKILVAAVLFDMFKPAKSCAGIHKDVVYNTIVNSGMNPLDGAGFACVCFCFFSLF